jgi:hypothetical protein
MAALIPQVFRFIRLSKRHKLTPSWTIVYHVSSSCSAVYSGIIIDEDTCCWYLIDFSQTDFGMTKMVTACWHIRYEMFN